MTHLKEGSLLQRDQVTRDYRANAHETATAHTSDQPRDEQDLHRRCEAAQRSSGREQEQGAEESAAPADDVGQAAVQGRERRGREEVRRAEETGLVRFLKRRRNVRDEGRDDRAIEGSELCSREESVRTQSVVSPGEA